MHRWLNGVYVLAVIVGGVAGFIVFICSQNVIVNFTANLHGRYLYWHKSG
jgi:uncharacterized membrane protein